jgi:aspartate aminotransferase
MTFAERLLNEARVAVIPGNPFGADGCVRLSYACSMETIEEAVGRMAGFIAELLSNA